MTDDTPAPQLIGPVVTHEDDCETEAWDDPVRGKVKWWTLLSGDRTPSERLTCGVAEIEPGRPDTLSPHRHAEPEVYHFLAGTGVVHIDGVETPVRSGSTVFVPGMAWHGVRNTGDVPLRLFYVFAVNSFADVEYLFPA